MNETDIRSRIIEALFQCLPYPQHITGLDLADPTTIRFRWRGTKFVISQRTESDQFSVEPPGFLSGSDVSILLEQLLKVTIYGSTTLAHAMS